MFYHVPSSVKYPFSTSWMGCRTMTPLGSKASSDGVRRSSTLFEVVVEGGIFSRRPAREADDDDVDDNDDEDDKDGVIPFSNSSPTLSSPSPSSSSPRVLEPSSAPLSSSLDERSPSQLPPPPLSPLPPSPPPSSPPLEASVSLSHKSI